MDEKLRVLYYSAKMLRAVSPESYTQGYIDGIYTVIGHILFGDSIFEDFYSLRDKLEKYFREEKI